MENNDSQHRRPCNPVSLVLAGLLALRLALKASQLAAAAEALDTVRKLICVDDCLTKGASAHIETSFQVNRSFPPAMSFYSSACVAILSALLAYACSRMLPAFEICQRHVEQQAGITFQAQ